VISQREHEVERRARVRLMEAMAELEESARDTEQMLLSSQGDVAALKLQLAVSWPAPQLWAQMCHVTARQALAAGRVDLQERAAASDAQVKKAAEELQLEQERRRVSDEGARSSSRRGRAAVTRTRAGLAAALAATFTMKEEIRALNSRVSAAEAAAASAAAGAAGVEKGGNGEGGGLAQQKEYIRKLNAVLKEREAELTQVTEQLKETRGQEARFLAEVQMLQGRIKKLSSSSVSRCAPLPVLRARIPVCFPCHFSRTRSRRQLETKVQALEAEGLGREQQASALEKMYKAQVTRIAQPVVFEACDSTGTFAGCTRHRHGRPRHRARRICRKPLPPASAAAAASPAAAAAFGRERDEHQGAAEAFEKRRRRPCDRRTRGAVPCSVFCVLNWFESHAGLGVARRSCQRVDGALLRLVCRRESPWRRR
jgi:hypothetical protein